MKQLYFVIIVLIIHMIIGCESFNLERKNFADCKAPSANVTTTTNRLQVNATLASPNQEFRTVEWDFGDTRGLPQYGLKAAYLYDRAGVYTIRARLTTVCSQTAAFSRTVTVTE